jgi:phosphotransferase system HPr (HPr) family protein
MTAMNGEIGAAVAPRLSREVVVANPQGLHLRPATAFALSARQFACDVVVARDDRRANGKSQMELLLLAAEPGARLMLEVSGPDAAHALERLAELLAAAESSDDPD